MWPFFNLISLFLVNLQLIYFIENVKLKENSIRFYSRRFSQSYLLFY